MKSSVKILASLVNHPSPSVSNAEVTESKYEGELGEAGPLGANQQSLLPRSLQRIVLDYLASDVNDDPRRYSEKQLTEFKLFGMPIAGARQIAEHIALGERTKALELIRKDLSRLHCVAEARDGFGRGALGSILYLAAAMGDFLLLAEVEKLLPGQEARALLYQGFSPGWKDEQKERDARYINAATQFRDRLKAKRLPNDMPDAQALEERKESVLELRTALRPKPDDPVITRGFVVNLPIYQEIYELFLKSEADLGGISSLDVDMLWGFGFQSLLGAGPPVLGQLLIGGADNIGGSKKFGGPDYMPPEVLVFADGSKFYDSSPLSGLGATFFVCGQGVKYDAAPVFTSWRERAFMFLNLDSVLKKLSRDATSSVTKLMQLPPRRQTLTTPGPRYDLRRMKITIKCIDGDESEITREMRETDTLQSFLEELHQWRFDEKKPGFRQCRLAGRQLDNTLTEETLKSLGFQGGCILQISTIAPSKEAPELDLSSSAIGMQLKDGWHDKDLSERYDPDVEDARLKKKLEKKRKNSLEIESSSPPDSLQQPTASETTPEDRQQPGKFKVMVIEQTSGAPKKFSVNIDQDETLPALISLIIYERRRRGIAPGELKQYQLNGSLIDHAKVTSSRSLETQGFSKHTILNVSTAVPEEAKHDLSAIDELQLPQPLFPIRLPEALIQLIAEYSGNELASTLLSQTAYENYLKAVLQQPEFFLLKKAIFPKNKKSKAEQEDKPGKSAEEKARFKQEQAFLFLQLSRLPETSSTLDKSFRGLQRFLFLNESQDNPDEFLMTCIQNGEHLKVLLLLRGNTEKRDLNHALISAIRRSDDYLVELLLNYGANPNYRHPIELDTPLTVAASMGAHSITQKLLYRGANVNLVDNNYLSGLAKVSPEVLAELESHQIESKTLQQSLFTPVTSEELMYLAKAIQQLPSERRTGNNTRLLFPSDSKADEEKKLLTNFKRFFKQVFKDDWECAIKVFVNRTFSPHKLDIIGINHENLIELIHYSQTPPSSSFATPAPLTSLTAVELTDLLKAVSSPACSQRPKNQPGYSFSIPRPIVIIVTDSKIEKLMQLYNRFFREHFGEHYQFIAQVKKIGNGSLQIFSFIDLSDMKNILRKCLDIQRASQPQQMPVEEKKKNPHPGMFESKLTSFMPLPEELGILPPKENKHFERLLSKQSLSVSSSSSQASPGQTNTEKLLDELAQFGANFLEELEIPDITLSAQVLTHLTHSTLWSSSLPSASTQKDIEFEKQDEEIEEEDEEEDDDDDDDDDEFEIQKETFKKR